MNLKHYFIAITLCAPYLSSLSGCQNHQDVKEKDLLTIHIKDYENKITPCPAVISSIDTIELDTHGYFMSDIKTVCISDTMAYVAEEPTPYGPSNTRRATSSDASGTWGTETGSMPRLGLWLWATASCT